MPPGPGGTPGAAGALFGQSGAGPPVAAPRSASGVDVDRVAASLDVQSVAYADFQCSARHHPATTQHPAVVLAVLRETGGDVQARTASR